MSGRGGDVPATVATGVRPRKGRNFCPEEEEQCCRSFMHTSTDSRRGIGQKNAQFWINVATHYARHKPEGGADRPARSLETKWSDIKQSVAKFSGCYQSVTDLNESGKSEDDFIVDAMTLYKQKCGKPFVLKHCWLLLKTYPRFAAIFMAKRKGLGSHPQGLPVDRRDLLSPNGQPPSTESVPGHTTPPAHTRPQGAKSSKIDHAHGKGKEQALRANAKATTDFAAATLKKAEQIAQQNTFSLFTLEDKNITCELAKQWLHLRRTQELAKLKAQVAAEQAAELAALNDPAPAPPRFGVSSSPGVATPAPAPAPTQSQHNQGLGFDAAPSARSQAFQQGRVFTDLNEDEDLSADDCAELDLPDDSSDLFSDRRRVQDLNHFGSDFGQPAEDREDNSTINLDSESTEFHCTPPPAQRRRLSIDPHSLHAGHSQFRTSGIRVDYANMQSSQQSTAPSYNAFNPQPNWLQGLGAQF